MGYGLIKDIPIELLLNMLMDLPWSIQGRLSHERQSPMFFQVNVNRYFTQKFLVDRVGRLLLDMIQEEGR